jgi:regulatory protein
MSDMKPCRRDRVQEQVITSVSRDEQDSRRYRIFLNGKFAFSVHEDILVKYQLLKGTSMDGRLVEDIQKEDERHRAYLCAIRYLRSKARTAKEIEIRLMREGFGPEAIESAVSRLVEQGYADDRLYAKQLADRRLSGGKGRRWIKQELMHKGVADESIQQAIDELNAEMEWEAAYGIAKKRWERLRVPVPERKRKVGAFLLRRGFPQSLAVRVIRKLTVETVNEMGDD